MKRISSKATFFYKRVFPVFWFGFIALFVLTNMLLFRRVPPAPFFSLLVAPMVMAIVGYVLFRKRLFDLVDEVWDDEDALVVINSGMQERIPFKNIINVGFSPFTNPERVTLTLREPSRPGAEITLAHRGASYRFRVARLLTNSSSAWIGRGARSRLTYKKGSPRRSRGFTPRRRRRPSCEFSLQSRIVRPR
jgi:hypothetical protein